MTVALIVLTVAFALSCVFVHLQASRHDKERERWEAERWRLITQIQHPEVVIPPPSPEAAERASEAEEDQAEQTEAETEAWDEVGRIVDAPAGGPITDEAQERL